MTKTIVLCNHSDLSEVTEKPSENVKILPINPSPPEENVQLRIDNITHRILSTLNPLAHDLLEIATYVYYADCSISRGTEIDIYAEQWKRGFDLMIPVSDPKIWNKPEIEGLLKEALNFLTGDDFSFAFLPLESRKQQLYFSFPDVPPPFPGSNSICLFSGGLDSLVGSLFLLRENNKQPLLVSHRSLPKIDSLQKKLVNLIRERNKDWEFPHLSMWINRKGNRAVEITQRSRSFLYLSIAASVASQLHIPKIYIC